MRPPRGHSRRSRQVPTREPLVGGGQGHPRHGAHLVQPPPPGHPFELHAQVPLVPVETGRRHQVPVRLQVGGGQKPASWAPGAGGTPRGAATMASSQTVNSSTGSGSSSSSSSSLSISKAARNASTASADTGSGPDTTLVAVRPWPTVTHKRSPTAGSAPNQPAGPARHAVVVVAVVVVFQRPGRRFDGDAGRLEVFEHAQIGVERHLPVGDLVGGQLMTEHQARGHCDHVDQPPVLELDHPVGIQHLEQAILGVVTQDQAVAGQAPHQDLFAERARGQRRQCRLGDRRSGRKHRLCYAPTLPSGLGQVVDRHSGNRLR